MRCYVKNGECRFYKPDHKINIEQIEKDIKKYSTYKK